MSASRARWLLAAIRSWRPALRRGVARRQRKKNRLSDRESQFSCRGRLRGRTPCRLRRIRAYLADGGVGSLARGAPTSSLAGLSALRAMVQKQPGTRHTVDRGASCATPSPERVLRRGHRRPSPPSQLTTPVPVPSREGHGRVRMECGCSSEAVRDRVRRKCCGNRTEGIMRRPRPSPPSLR